MYEVEFATLLVKTSSILTIAHNSEEVSAIATDEALPDSNLIY